MTPRAIADALSAATIDGLTHTLASARPDAEPYLDLSCGAAVATIYADADDLSAVLAIAGHLLPKSFHVTKRALRADLVEILSWSLNATHPDPAAPETRAALRAPGLASEILREHLNDRRAWLVAVDFPDHRPLVAALSAALRETLT